MFKDKIHRDLRVVLGLFCFMAGWWLIVAGLSWLVGLATLSLDAYFGTLTTYTSVKWRGLGLHRGIYAIAAVLVGVRLLSYVWEWFVPALPWLTRRAWWAMQGVMFVVGFAKFLFHNRKPPKQDTPRSRAARTPRQGRAFQSAWMLPNHSPDWASRLFPADATGFRTMLRRAAPGV